MLFFWITVFDNKRNMAWIAFYSVFLLIHIFLLVFLLRKIAMMQKNSYWYGICIEAFDTRFIYYSKWCNLFISLSLSSLYIPLVCVWLLHLNKLIIRLNTSSISVLMIQMLLPVIYYLFIVNQISTSSAGPISNKNKVNDMYKFITVMLQKK